MIFVFEKYFYINYLSFILHSADTHNLIFKDVNLYFFYNVNGYISCRDTQRNFFKQLKYVDVG